MKRECKNPDCHNQIEGKSNKIYCSPKCIKEAHEIKMANEYMVEKNDM